MKLPGCRFLNALCFRPPLRWLLPAPAAWNRMEPLRHLQQRVEQGTTFLDGFGWNHAPKDHLLLDAGCGMGDRTVAASLAGAKRSIGIDTDPEKLHWARLLAVQNRCPADFLLGSVVSLPCPDASFDLVLLLDVIEHLEEPLAALTEVHRVLRPGGRVLMTFPPYNSPWGAHLTEHVVLPWAHLLCPEAELLALWREIHRREVARGRVCTGAQRQRCIMAAASITDLWSLNRMTIHRFLELLSQASLKPAFIRFHTPGGLAAPLTRSRLLREYVTTRVNAVAVKRC